MRKKWWILPLAVLCIAAVFVFTFGDTILVHVSPKTVLASALTHTAEQLAARLESGPAAILAGTIDGGGQYTVDLDLEKADEKLGTVIYDMSVRTDGVNHQFQADGTVTVKDSSLDMSVYLDQDFAGLTSGTLLQGNYYGITYDTFSQDIRGSKTLTYLIGEDTLSQWESSVEQLKELMERDFTFSAPELSEDDIRNLILGIITLDADVESEKLMLNGEEISAFRIDFYENKVVIEGLGEFSEVNASFWIYEGAVIQARVDAAAGEDAYCIRLSTGINAAADPLTVTYESAEQFFSLSSGVAYDESHYAETLEIEANGKSHVVAYDWSRDSGEMTLEADGTAVTLNLSKTDDGFCVQTEDMDVLMALIQGKKQTETSASRCTMYVSKGSSISTPDYKNMDQWSVSDLLVLFGGIGSMFGLNLE